MPASRVFEISYALRQKECTFNAGLELFRSQDGGPFQYVGSAGGGGAIGSNRTVPANTKQQPYMCFPFTRSDLLLDAGATNEIIYVYNPVTVGGPDEFSSRTHNLGQITSYNTFQFDNLVVAYDEDSDVTVLATRSSSTYALSEQLAIFTGGTPFYGGIPRQVIGYDSRERGRYHFRTAAGEICCALAARDGKVYALIWDGISQFNLHIIDQLDATLITTYAGPFLTPRLGDLTESIRTDGQSVWAFFPDQNTVGKWSPDGTFSVLANLAGGVGFKNDAGTLADILGGNQMYICDTYLITQGTVSANGGAHPIFRHQLIRWNALSGSDISLASIVTELCARRGITDVDVSSIDDVVHGYIVTKQMSARAALEYLLGVFRIDVVERGPKLVFVKRGGAPVRTLTLDDIGAHEYGTDPVDPLTIERKQEVDLPETISVNFTDLANAYQSGSVVVHRQNTTSQQAVTLDITALALSPDEAARIADIAMQEAWVGRETYRFATIYRHADLEPTDVILLDAGDVTYRMRITRRTDKGGMIEWEAVADSAYATTSVAVGGGAQSATQVATSARTDLVLMDIPILRDEDDDAGFYARLAPTGPRWRGATLFDRTHGALTVEGTVLSPNPVGVTTTLLPPASSSGWFDEASSVDVTVFGGLNLHSVSRDQALSGLNTFLIGDEIVVARDALLMAPNSYRLSGLLRRRRDTSDVGHVVGERFVALGLAGTLRVNHGAGDIGVSHDYIAVSQGRPLSTGDAESLANTARGKKPFRPIHLGGGPTGTTDVLLSWVRQTRLAAPLRSGTGAPLDEPLEAYTIEIANDAAFTDVRRRFSGVGAPPFVYGRADRYTDELGGLLSPFYWRVAQESAVVGLGTFSASASLTAAPATLPPVVVPTGPGAWNPDDFGRADAVITFSDGNNTASFLNGPHNFTALRSIDSISFGRKYFEFLVLGVPGTTSNMLLGIVTRSTVLIGDQIGSPSGLGLYYRPNGQVFTVSGTSVGFVGSGPPFSAGDVIAFAVDDNTGAAWILRNNVSLGGSPSAGTSPLFAFTPGTELLPLMGQHSEVGASSTLRLSAASQSYAAPTGFSPVR